MSGVSNTDAMGRHDIIHNAEFKEEMPHERDDTKSESKQNNATEGTPAGSAEAAPKQSTLDKVKGAFHRQARRAERGF